MFTEKEIREANKTARSNGASAINLDGTIRAIVPNFIYKNIDKYRDKTILDYGSGKDPIHTKWLKGQGFDVTPYDFGENCIEGIHDKNALDKRYDVIFASNVLNVQSSDVMMETTLCQIYKALKKGGKFIFNYPKTPRKLDMPEWELITLVSELFDRKVVNNEGIFTVVKPNDTDEKIFISVKDGLVQEVYCSNRDMRLVIIDNDVSEKELVTANKKASEEQKNYYKIY